MLDVPWLLDTLLPMCFCVPLRPDSPSSYKDTSRTGLRVRPNLL